MTTRTAPRTASPALSALLLASAALGTSGCPSAGKRDARAEARHNHADAAVDAGLTVVDPASGLPVLIGQDRLPDTFPKSVPLYPGARLLGSVVTTENGKRTHVVTFATTDMANVVDEFYRTHLKGFLSLDERTDDMSRTRSYDATDAAVPLRVSVVTARSGPGTTLQIKTVEG